MKKKLDDILFNGYVREPLPMVIPALFVGVVFLVFAIWSTIDLCTPSSYDTTAQLLRFVEYEKDGPIYSLLASDGFYYDLRCRAIEGSLEIEYLIENETPFFVEYVSPAAGNMGSRDIVSISTHEQQPLIPSNIISEACNTDAKNAAIIMWSACLLYWLFISSSYYFISNAPKYPRIAALLVKKSFRYF